MDRRFAARAIGICLAPVLLLGPGNRAVVEPSIIDSGAGMARTKTFVHDASNAAVSAQHRGFLLLMIALRGLHNS